MLCDMKPVHAKLPAYKLLAMRGIVCFTPMHERVFTQGGKRRRELVPVVQDLLFARSTLSVLTPIIEATPTLRYRFVRNYHNRHMTVPDEEMERFMRGEYGRQSTLLPPRRDNAGNARPHSPHRRRPPRRLRRPAPQAARHTHPSPARRAAQPPLRRRRRQPRVCRGGLVLLFLPSLFKCCFFARWLFRICHDCL